MTHESATLPPEDEGLPESSQPLLGREQDAPRWLIVAMICGMLLLVAGGFHWAQQAEFGKHVIGRAPSVAVSGSINTLDEIQGERVPHNLIGRDVALWAVPVTHVPGDYIFWIGHPSDRRVPVVLLGESTTRQPETGTEVRVGDTLAIFGTVRASRELRLLEEDWAMSRAEWDELEREQIYISALRVEHIKRATGH